MASDGKKSKKKKIIIISIIVVVLVTLGLVVVFNSKRETILPVQIEKVKRHNITQLVTATGKIQPEVQVKITPEVSGEIVALPVKEGQRVKKGDLLLRIKPDVYQAQRDQVSAALLSAKANLSRTEPEFKRVSEMFQRGLASQSEFDQARAAFEVSKAGYAQAQASLNQADENLKKTAVFSPMDGTVSSLKSELGERVLGTAQFQGTEVMTIADLSRMEARVDISETDVILLAIGDTARISVDAYPDMKVDALVYEIANTAKTRGLGTQEEVTNFEVKIRILNPGVALKPGMSMICDIETETKKDILAVPIQSVTTRAPKVVAKQEDKDGQGGDFVPEKVSLKTRSENRPREVVFLIDGGLVRAVPVKRGISNDSYVEILEGLDEGAEVVSGSYKAINRELQDSTKVRIEEAKKLSRESAEKK